MKFPRLFYIIVVLLLLVVIPFRAAAQEDAPFAGGLADTVQPQSADAPGLEPAGYAGVPEPNNNAAIAAIQYPKPAPDTTEFFIRNIIFDITGLTRKFAILYHTEITRGERIIGRENLEKYRLDKIQLLMNQRALDSADIRCFEGTALEDGSVPVDLLIITKDTWNIIILPKPQYDDNTGFELTLKARDYNFLGTLSPLRIDLGYTRYEDKVLNFSKDTINFAIDSDIPFRAFNFNWNVNFDHVFNVTTDPDADEWFYYKNTTGLSMELPVGFTTATFGFDQSTIVNEDNKEVYIDDYDPQTHGGRFLPVYFTSAAYVSWKIPTPLEVGRFGRLTYTPKISGRINYLPANEGYIDDLRRGPAATLGHSLGFGRVDWIDNYRSGFDASIGNSNTYNFYREDWGVSYDIAAAYHHIFTGFFGISGRLLYQQWLGLDAYTKTAGDVIRGILDKNLCAEYMLSLNLDFPLRVLRFVPSQWFNTPWLRLFNFDLHVSPFFDMALLRNPVTNTEFWSKPAVGTGFELIVFPHFFRSLYLRVSLGYDVNAAIQSGKIGKWDELFIGIGHYY